jgi:hypothetical protein
MNSILILQLVALSALAAYPMAWVQRRVAIWTNGRLVAKNPNAQTPPMANIHRTALSFFTRVVILIAMLTFFRFLLSE